jgi:hypothetical protein
VTGEPDQSRAHLVAALALAERVRQRWWLASVSYDMTLLALYEGDWRRAREMGDIGLAVQPRDPRHLALRAVLEYGLGDGDAGAPYVAQLHEVAESVPPPGPIADHVFLAGMVPFVSRCTNTDVGLDVASVAAQRVLSLPRVAPVLAMIARRGLALTAVERRDATAAERLYGELESGRGTASIFIPLTVDRLLGLLAAAFGGLDAARGHFEDGLAFCARAGYRPEYAWTASDYAETLLAGGISDDRSRAVALQDEALGIARELGMRPLLERILARRELLTA